MAKRKKAGHKRRRPGSGTTAPASAPSRDAGGPPEPLGFNPLAWTLGVVLAIQPLVLHLFVTDEYETPKLVFLRCGAALVTAAWFVTALRRGVPRFFFTSLMPLLGFCAAMGLATVTSSSPATSFIGEYGSLAGLQSQLMYLVICAAALSLAGQRDARVVLLWVLAGGILSTGMALVEASGHEIGTFFGMTAEIPAHTTSGTFGNANYFAGYTVSLIPIAVFFARDRNRILAAGAILLAIASAVAVFISGSRAGFLCLSVVALWLPFGLWHSSLLARLQQRRAKAQADANQAAGDASPRGLQVVLRKQAALVALVVAAIIGVGLYIASAQVQRVGRSLARPMAALSADRTHLWSPALDIALDHPLLGSGLDTFGTTSPRYFSTRVYKRLGASVTARRAHNEALNMLACAGLLGFAAWLWLFGGAIWRGFRRSWQGAGNLDPSLIFAISMALSLGFGFNLLHFITVGQAPFLFTLIGLLLGATSQAERRPDLLRLGKRGTAIGVSTTAVLFLLFAWDGARWIDADGALKDSVVASMRRQPAKALQHADLAAELRPFERRYQEARAQLHLRAATAAGAERRSDHIAKAQVSIDIALGPSRPPLGLWIALSLAQQLGDIDRATALALEAMQRDPTRPGMLRKTVNWFVNKGQLEPLPKFFAPAYRQDPQRAAALAIELSKLVLRRLPQLSERQRYMEMLDAVLRPATEVEEHRQEAQDLLERIAATS